LSNHQWLRFFELKNSQNILHFVKLIRPSTGAAWKWEIGIRAGFAYVIDRIRLVNDLMLLCISKTPRSEL
jgi:hypothetical protein